MYGVEKLLCIALWLQEFSPLIFFAYANEYVQLQFLLKAIKSFICQTY